MSSVATLVVEGCPPWDGRYPVADWFFTLRELNTIKQVSGGIRAGELLEALDANDAAAFVAVAHVILARHGKQVDPDDLWDAKVGAIGIELGEDDDSVPLDSPSESDGSVSLPSSTAGSDDGGAS